MHSHARFSRSLLLLPLQFLALTCTLVCLFSFASPHVLHAPTYALSAFPSSPPLQVHIPDSRFRNARKEPYIKCHLKTQEGYIFLLDDGVSVCVCDIVRAQLFLITLGCVSVCVT